MGSKSYYRDEVFQLAWFIGTCLKHRRSLDLAGWVAWGNGFPVTPFVRELLLFSCERQTEDIRGLVALLRGPKAEHWGRRFKYSMSRHPEGTIYSGLPLTVFTEAWTAMLEAFLGKWHRRKRLDPRVPAVGAAMNEFGIDLADKVVGKASWQRAHPIAHALHCMQLPDAMTADTLHDLSTYNSNPVLLKWLRNASDSELERQRDAARGFVAECLARVGGSPDVDMDPAGFLMFLRTYVLRGGGPSLWPTLYDMLVAEVLGTTTGHLGDETARPPDVGPPAGG